MLRSQALTVRAVNFFKSPKPKVNIFNYKTDCIYLVICKNNVCHFPDVGLLKLHTLRKPFSLSASTINTICFVENCSKSRKVWSFKITLFRRVLAGSPLCRKRRIPPLSAPPNIITLTDNKIK